MKNQKIIIVIIGVILLMLAGAGYFVVSSKKEAPKPLVSEPQTPVEETVNILSPQDLGLSLRPISANKKLLMEIEKTDDISSLDYELSYTSMGNIPRGVIGHIDVKQPGKKVVQEITLGTCSDVCHYDEDVSDIKLILKVAKTDGRIFQVEKSLEL